MSLEIHINPLVDWIWMGFGVLAFGTGIALLPESTFAFALAKLPAEAATTDAVAPAGVRARSLGSGTQAVRADGAATRRSRRRTTRARRRK